MKFFLLIFAIVGLTAVESKFPNDRENQLEKHINKNFVRELSETPLVEIAKSENLESFHWLPWRTQSHILEKDEEEKVCRDDSSLDEFPDDLFSQEQRLQGAIVLHFIGAIYFFTTIGLVINYYFIPSVECICDDLKVSSDVGGAVFMATAAATPELFTNIIGTFIADSDMGLGAIVGAQMFNILGVSALASLVTSNPVRMEWVPITRDSVIFAINIIVLIATSWDGYIHWYEALILSLFAIPYYLIMFQSTRISRFLKRKFEDEYRCCNSNNYDFDNSGKEVQVNSIYTKDGIQTIDTLSVVSNKSKDVEKPKVDENVLVEIEKKQAEEKEAHDLVKKQRLGLWPCPNESLPRSIFWYYSWPIRAMLFCTTPNPRTQRRWYPLTFLMCIGWIGIITYLIFFMLIIISYTFSIPESVMGLTVFAIGATSPEIVTGFIMARKGDSGVSVATSLGAASLAILLGLGVPWFFRAVISSYGHEKSYVNLHSNGMEYVILSLILLIFIFYLIMYFTHFTLRKLTGTLLFSTYAIFITFAILMEVGVFFDLICIPY